MSDALQDLDFDALIDRSLDDPDAAAELERRYLTEAAVLVVDFTSMVKRTEALGIVYALATARAAMRSMEPAIERHGGQVLKQVADTFFAVFPSPAAALLAALDGQRAIDGFNGGRSDPISACMGLGFGTCLLVPDLDVFGAEVNRAFVLGEDTAEGGEVLATPALMAALGSPPAGIGAFQANADRAHRVGFHFTQVRDYR